MLKMAGSQAKLTKIKTPRGQAWPAEIRTSGHANANPVSCQLMKGPARRRGHRHRQAQTGSADRRVMVTTAMTQAETSMSVRSQLSRKSRPSSGIDGMKMQEP